MSLEASPHQIGIVSSTLNAAPKASLHSGQDSDKLHDQLQLSEDLNKIEVLENRVHDLKEQLPPEMVCVLVW